MTPSLRAAWYAAYEPLRLRVERLFHDFDEGGEPLVSVYIPTHNRAKLLMDRAIESVRHQTYGNLEIIVAAHGCTDDTVRQVRGLADGRVRLIEVPRTQTYPPTAENHWLAGPVVPANAALKACRGDWIARIDDDDIWRPTHVESLLRLATDFDFEFVSALYQTHEGIPKPYMVHGVEIGGTQTWLYRSYLKFMKYNPDCWKKHRNRVNDVDLQERFVKAGVQMGFLNKVVADVIPRPGEKDVGSKAYKSNPDLEREMSFVG